MDQPSVSETRSSHPPAIPKPASSGTPTLKLRLRPARRSSASTQPSQSFQSESLRSPLRQASTVYNSEPVISAKIKPAQVLHAKQDSDLSSVDEDITNQDQSTFLQMSGPRTRSQIRKRQHELDPDEQTSNKRLAVAVPVDGAAQNRARYISTIVTENDVKSQTQHSSIRPDLRRHTSVTPENNQINPSSPSQPRNLPNDSPVLPHTPDSLHLKAPLAHLDSVAGATDLAEGRIPTALGRPKKIKTPKVKTPQSRHGEDRARRTVLAGKPELHDNNRRLGRPTSSGGSSENSDYCAACGGDGYLLCCDGVECKRSFHFNCVSPPISDTVALEESWYCDDCRAKERLSEPPEDTIWNALFNEMDKKNPAAFSLPQPLRERYPNVTTTANGEYYESTVPDRAGGRRGNAASMSGDPPYDYFRTHDPNTGRRLVCHACSLGARHPDKALVACDYCDKAWHMDCLAPARAHHPHRYTPDNKQRHAWMCPLHAAHDLAHIDAISVSNGVRPEIPTHKLRVPKNVAIVRSTLRHGVPNNGDIDITFVDDDLSVRHARRLQRRQEDTTVRYQLSDEEIVLDFIHKVKAQHVQTARGEYLRAVRALRAKTEHEIQVERLKLENAKMLEAKLAEQAPRDQQAALRLVQLATGRDLSDVSCGKVNELLMTLIAEAPEEALDGADVLKNPDAMALDDQQYDELLAIHRKMTAVLEKEKAKRKRVSRPSLRALGK